MRKIFGYNQNYLSLRKIFGYGRKNFITWKV